MWASLIFFVLSGKVKFGPNLRHIAEEILRYPTHGDSAKVYSTVRSAEGAFGGFQSLESDFVDRFWSQCMAQSACTPENQPIELEEISVGTTLERVNEAYARLVDHTNQTRTTTATDARHDAVFGIGLYAISILQELMRFGAAQTISAQMQLRTLLECFLTLAYLAEKDSDELWQSYRSFGAGQTKLAYLKLDQSEEQVGYVKLEVLHQLANEDRWQEFVSINLGHWEKSNLRKMSQDAGTKLDYDNYYGWTSAFVHGHWGAVRDAVFETCLNPLHRLHRIPRPAPRTQEDVVSDACRIVDKTLETISKVYPTFAYRVTL